MPILLDFNDPELHLELSHFANVEGYDPIGYIQYCEWDDSGHACPHQLAPFRRLTISSHAWNICARTREQKLSAGCSYF